MVWKKNIRKVPASVDEKLADLETEIAVGCVRSYSAAELAEGALAHLGIELELERGFRRHQFRCFRGEHVIRNEIVVPRGIIIGEQRLCLCYFHSGPRSRGNENTNSSLPGNTDQVLSTIH